MYMYYDNDTMWAMETLSIGIVAGRMTAWVAELSLRPVARFFSLNL